MKDIFISYSSKDDLIARELVGLFGRNGWDSFLASRDILPGEEYAAQIVNSIDNAKVMVLIMSNHSNESQHVLREVERAVGNNLPIIVYFTENVVLSKSMEYFVKTQQWIMKDAYQNEKLLIGIQGILSNNAVAVNSNKIKVPAGTSYKAAFIIALAFLVLMTGVVAFLSIKVANLTELIAQQAATASPEHTTPSTEIAENPTTKPTEGTSGVPTTGAETTSAETTATTPAETSAEVTSAEEETIYKLGDTLTLGRYNDLDIEWRILHFNEDGTAVLIAKECISFKPFDAPEGGKHNNYEGKDYGSYDTHVVTDPLLNSLIRGNSDWSLSNLRTWLNSSLEIVHYTDQAPSKSALDADGNYYENEAGFLFYWDEADRNLLKLTTNRTPANELAGDRAIDGYIISEEYVYLLSESELSWFDDAGFLRFTTSTDIASEQAYYHSKTYNEKNYKTNTVEWWLRDPVLTEPEGVGTRVLAVPYANSKLGNNLITSFCNACAGSYGVRPVVTIDLNEYKNR